MEDGISSIAISCIRAEQLPKISDITKRENTTASGGSRYYDLVLPSDARIFMTDMIGPTNYNKIGCYFWMTYHLFPREIGTSLDHITRLTKDGFLGQTSESDQEILTNGFNVRLDVAPDSSHVKCQRLSDLAIKKLANPDWFGSNSDMVIAFLLPLLTALAGMWLFRLLFPALSVQMPLLEQLACGLGLGMMAVAALTLGVKLCGYSGQRLIFAVTALGGIAEIWRDREAFLKGIDWRFPEADSPSCCHYHFGGWAAGVSDSLPSRRATGACRWRCDDVDAQGEDNTPLHRKRDRAMVFQSASGACAS